MGNPFCEHCYKKLYLLNISPRHLLRESDIKSSRGATHSNKNDCFINIEDGGVSVSTIVSNFQSQEQLDCIQTNEIINGNIILNHHPSEDSNDLETNSDIDDVGVSVPLIAANFQGQEEQELETVNGNIILNRRLSLDSNDLEISSEIGNVSFDYNDVYKGMVCLFVCLFVYLIFYQSIPQICS